MNTEPLREVIRWFIAQQWPAMLAMLLGAFVAAWLVDFIFRRLLRGLTRLVPRWLDQMLLEHLRRPLSATAFLLVVQLGLRLFLPSHPWRGGLLALLQSLLVVLWATAAIRLLRTFFDHLAGRHHANPALLRALPLLSNLVTVVLVLAGIHWLLVIWDISVAPLLASAGIATAAVALASKDTLANFFGGLSIFMDHPYAQGDFILLPSGERGEVVRIGVRSTRVLTRDDVLITVPNADMANSKIINESGEVPRFRLRAAVGVAYGSDLDQVEAALLKSLEGIPEILAQPEPRTRLRRFGDSALEYELLAWIDRPVLRGSVLHRINRNIYNIFRQQGIEIPFPQRVVHLPGRAAPPQ